MVRKKITVKGLKTYYIDECLTDSSRGTVLFLNGWRGSSLSWSKNIVEISKTYRCVAVDLPGFGISEEPRCPWSPVDYANFIKSFSRILGIKRFTLVGKSFGGRIATIYASQYPNDLVRLILVASAGVEKR